MSQSIEPYLFVSHRSPKQRNTRISTKALEKIIENVQIVKDKETFKAGKLNNCVKYLDDNRLIVGDRNRVFIYDRRLKESKLYTDYSHMVSSQVKINVYGYVVYGDLEVYMVRSKSVGPIVHCRGQMKGSLKERFKREYKGMETLGSIANTDRCYQTVRNILVYVSDEGEIVVYDMNALYRCVGEGRNVEECDSVKVGAEGETRVVDMCAYGSRQHASKVWVYSLTECGLLTVYSYDRQERTVVKVRGKQVGDQGLEEYASCLYSSMAVCRTFKYRNTRPLLVSCTKKANGWSQKYLSQYLLVLPYDLSVVDKLSYEDNHHYTAVHRIKEIHRYSTTYFVCMHLGLMLDLLLYHKLKLYTVHKRYKINDNCNWSFAVKQVKRTQYDILIGTSENIQKITINNI